VSIPAALLLIVLVLTKGADLGVKALYVVVAILFLSLVLFFLGKTDYYLDISLLTLNLHVESPDDFFYVFAICFPAFTGMTAGVGLSGDLARPRVSIPRGTLMATLLGMSIYFFIVWKLYVSMPPEALADPSRQLIMQDIALWGPIIPIGLAAATVSSALGSIMVAPRTLQALASDGVFPSESLNQWLARGKEKSNEPVNATLITAALTLVVLIVNDVNTVAEVITMFFMVTYGAICTISFLEHFTGDPAYRPTFRSKWYFSLIGALSCLTLMLTINPLYAFVAVAIMVLIYIGISQNKSNKKGMAYIFQGVIFQISRELQVFLQKADKDTADERWRPSIICLSSHSFHRFAAFDLLRWLSHKYGFGTYIHFIPGYLSKETHHEAEASLRQLIQFAEFAKSNVYLDTLVSPSLRTAIAQVVQIPGVSGKENNMILFEYSKKEPEGLQDIVDNFQLVKATDFDVCVLGSSERNFGYQKEIHIWITSQDYENASLMILIGYIMTGYPTWGRADIKLFAVFPESELAIQRAKLLDLIQSGRLPISASNVQEVIRKEEKDIKQLVNERSAFADLTILGLRSEAVKHFGKDVFSGYDEIGDILFVNSSKIKNLE